MSLPRVLTYTLQVGLPADSGDTDADTLQDAIAHLVHGSLPDALYVTSELIQDTGDAPMADDVQFIGASGIVRSARAGAHENGGDDGPG